MLQSVVFTVILFSSFANGFNFDTDSALIYRGPVGYNYGFSVAQHRDRGEGWLLIGAPLAQTIQPNVTNGGAVYRCKPDDVNTCQQVLFDEKGPAYVLDEETSELVQSENKSNQWFGATVSSSGETGKIVACAPRYVYYSISLKRREPIGMCFISTGGFHGIIPLESCKKQDEWGYHRLGSCQLGFSASISEDGKRLFMGAVGSYYWQGQVYSYDFYNTSSYYQTGESPLTDDDSYLGYSMTIGRFSAEDELCVAVGMPKGSNLKGKVVVFRENLANIYNESGDIMGSYFGYVLAAADVNGDGLDDIVVGAPFYTPTTDKETGYEHGAIYVVYQIKKGEFEKKDLIVGTKSKARFGLSVAKAGDTNKDGYDDIAVGAPYDGPAESGAVYIFNGGKDGLNLEPSQVIYAEDFGESRLKTFGFSLSGGMDMDRNQYPDLLIGAYSSDIAIHLRGRPIVNVNTTFKLDPENINLDSKGCGTEDGTTHPCVLANLCFSYNGINVEDRLTFIYDVKIDMKTESIQRAYLLNRPKRKVDRFAIDLSRTIQKCTSFYIYLEHTKLRDKLTPIEIDIEYNISDHYPSRIGRMVKPILNKAIPNVLNREINIQKNCGPDNVCVPDLVLNVSANTDRYLIGSKTKLELEVIVQNDGEDAFEANMYLHIPLDIQFINIYQTKLELPISCTPPQPEKTGINLLKCELDNPLPAGQQRIFTVILDQSKNKTMSATPDLTFIFQVNSSNGEYTNTTEDNRFVIGLPVRVEANLISKGASSPPLVLHNVAEPIQKTKSSEIDIGEQVIHMYQLHNKGPSEIKRTKITILWPSKTLDGKYLLYLMDQPDITGSVVEGSIREKVSCQTITLDEVNPLRLPARKSGSKTVANDTVLRSMLGDEPYLPFHEFDDLQFHTLFRTKRHYKPVPYEQRSEILSLEDAMSCGPTICTRIHCIIDNFQPDDKILFSIRSRLWKETVQEFGLREFEISSKFVAVVTHLPHNVNPSFIPPEIAIVKTQVQLIGLDQTAPISLWIIILAIIGGLLLLSLLIIALWKFGFFKRKRPPTSGGENEPLQQGNGYNYRKGDTSL